MTVPSVLLVVTHCPDGEVAETIARALVDQRLAACVSILAPCRSIYEWRGKSCTDVEVPLLIKTTPACYPAVEATIRQLHSYELPEIVAVDIARGLPAYLGWVASQVAVPAAD